MNKRKRKSKQSKTKHKSKHSMLFKIFTGGVLAFTGYNVYKLYSNWGAYRFAIKLAKYRNSPPMAIAYFSYNLLKKNRDAFDYMKLALPEFKNMKFEYFSKIVDETLTEYLEYNPSFSEVFEEKYISQHFDEYIALSSLLFNNLSKDSVPDDSKKDIISYLNIYIKELQKEGKEINELSNNSKLKDLEKVKKQLSKKYHPDKASDDNKQKYPDIMAEINNKIDILEKILENESGPSNQFGRRKSRKISKRRKSRKVSKRRKSRKVSK